MAIFGHPLLLTFVLLAGGCATGSDQPFSGGWSPFSIAGRNPDDCHVEEKATVSQRTITAPQQVPTKEEIRSFQDDNCGPDCARTRARRHLDDVARRQSENRAEARHQREIKARELDCILGSGCIRRGVLAGIAR